MNHIPIAFAFDRNLTLPACVCLSSLMMNAYPDTFYDIFILYPEKEEPDREMLNQIPTHFKNCTIAYRAVGNQFDNAFEIRGITTPAYYRLLIPELIPEYDKIIYSDVDVIFRMDLSEIYQYTNLEAYDVAGVNAIANQIPDLTRYYQNTLNIDPSKIIYSGNLLIHSKELKAESRLSLFTKLARRKYKFQDMDIINIACNGNICYLPLGFCMTTYLFDAAIHHRKQLTEFWSESQIDRALKCGTIHYNGEKPWKKYCVNFDIWWEYYRKSPFYDPNFYFDFFYSKLDELDKLSLWKRIKILIRYFVYGRK